MRRHRAVLRAVLAVASLATVVACGALGTTTSPSATTAGASGSVPSVAPFDPGSVGLTCGDGIVFHPSLLGQPASAENDPDPVAAVLRAFLAGPDAADLPRSGWIRLAQSASLAQFVASDEDGVAVVGFALRGGQWQLDMAGACQPEVALPGGAGRAEWRLDPAFPDPGPTDRTIHVLINERACAGGQSPEGRVLPPAITVTAESVAIAIAVQPRPGGNDCMGNPDSPMTIELPEPLDGRPLFDGAVFPPAGPIASYGLECGDVPAQACALLARDIVANAKRLHPGKRVVQVFVHSADGDYDVLFDDGTGIGSDVN
jgi:hypothetical protein